LRKILADCDSIKTLRELRGNLIGLFELKDDATTAEIVSFTAFKSSNFVLACESRRYNYSL